MSSAEPFAVVLFGRVSQIADERARSVDDQLTELRRWAAREGWPVYSEHRDDAVSASRFANGRHRAGWTRVMGDLATGVPRGLLTWEFSRNTRDMEVYVGLEAVCRAHHVLLGYSSKLHDLNTSDGMFSVGLDALLAAREPVKTSENVRRAVNSRAAAGRPHGSVPYGYRRVIDPVSGRVLGREIDSEQGRIVAEIVARLLGGEAAESLAAELNTRGVRTAQGGRCRDDRWGRCPCRDDPDWTGQHLLTSGRWTGANLSKMVQRPTYAGLRVFHGEVLRDVDATWPPIITREQHDRLRVLYGDPARDRFRSDGRVKHLGAGLFRCGRDGCDGVMRRLALKPPRRPAYACRSCLSLQRDQQSVDNLVERLLVARLSRPDFLDLFAGPDRSSDRDAARAEVAALRAEEADVRRLFAAGDLTPADMAAWRRGWTGRLSDAEQRATPPSVPTALGALAGPNAAERWAGALIGAKREVLDTLMVVTILPVGRQAREFDPDRIKIEWKASR